MVFLADPIDPSTLPRGRDDFNLEYARIPADRILDVVLTASVTASPFCREIMSPRFARGYAHQPLDQDDAHLTLHRRPLTVLPDGRVVLQHTRVLNADFTVAPVSPGSLPPLH